MKVCLEFLVIQREIEVTSYSDYQNKRMLPTDRILTAQLLQLYIINQL